MSHDLYRCTPRQTREFITDALYAGLVPMVVSSPGTGKSSIYRQVANDLNLKLIDHRLSTSAPEDLSGLPRFYTDEDGIERAQFVPFDFLPIEGTKLPKDKDGWLIFFDEFNSAPKQVEAAAYKTVLDRMTGQERLHERVAMGGAGNLSTDRAIVNNLSTAMQSRLVHIEMYTVFKEWLEDVAIAHGYDYRIKAFLSYKEQYLMDFRPDHHEKTFCCPRTWEFMDRLIRGREVSEKKTALYAGTITSGVAAEFVTFCQIYGKIPTLKEVLADPLGTPVPQQTDMKWAIISSLMDKVDEHNFTDLAKYINRFEGSMRILFYRNLAQNLTLKQHPAYRDALLELSKYLHD